LPMLRASAIVTTQAVAASAARAIHGRMSWRRGRLCTGRVTAAEPAWLAMIEPSSACVAEVGDEAVGPGEAHLPVAAVTHVLGHALPDGLRYGAEWRVRDHGWFPAVHPGDLVTTHLKLHTSK